jgi:Transposase IS116/IS110/IS902 family
LLPEAWIAPQPVRQLRALLRHRASLVRLGTQLRNRIHAVAADFGYDRPGSYWTGPGRGWLAELDLPPVSREIVTDCLASIDALAPLIERLDGELHQRAKADQRVKVLKTLPGVGEFTALVLLAEVGDIGRFASARKLASWAGLTPTVRGSDLTVRHGHIWKAGLSVAAVGPQPGGADRQALPGLRRHLHRHRSAPREEDRHHRGRPQTPHPRLPPARRGTGRRDTQHDQASYQRSLTIRTLPRPGGSPDSGHARSCGMSRPSGRTRS